MSTSTACRLLDVDDAALASGRAALLTHRTSAEFDNVIASPTPATILYAADFTTSGGPTDLWSFTGTGLWNTVASGSNRVFAQSSVAGAARAVIGVPTDDQSVDVRARPTTFAGTGGGDRWFGVMARYVDDANYYYLTVRSTNTVSLRKLTNGAITVLGTYSLPVTLGTWYRCASRPWVRGSAATSTASWWPKPTIPRMRAERRDRSPIAPPWISTTTAPSSPEKATSLISL